MNKLIHKLLSFLKEHINQNNREIQVNQEEIDKLLSDISLNTRKKDLDSKQDLNRQLLSENSDFLKIQLELSEFMEKYKYLFPGYSVENQRNSIEEDYSRKLFAQTVNGRIKYDASHPQYHSPIFFTELLKYYEIHEDYEMCAKLLEQRKL